MKSQTVEACAEFAEKSGRIIAALVREQPGCISTIAFREFVTLCVGVTQAIENDHSLTIRGSEAFEEFQKAKAHMIASLETEEGPPQ
jgi:hypothetical protein